MPVRNLLTIPIAVLSVVAVAACGQVTIDKGKAEDLAKKVANSGTGKLKTITCPDGEKAKKGATFDCDLVYADGTKGTITLHQTDDSGGVRTAGSDIHIAGQ
jgi:hypothetical protein